MSYPEEPHFGTTRPRSFAAISPELRTSTSTVTFHCRRDTEREWRVTELRELEQATSIIKSQLDGISTSETRTILLNDDIDVDMPAVTLEDLERILKEESVLGSGRKAQIFVVVYDHDPTRSVETDDAVLDSGRTSELEVIQQQRKRIRGNRETSCGCIVV